MEVHDQETDEHPFTDGNRRISRIMMNAELVAADQSKIIIPTVFREDYLNALRRLTRRNDPQRVAACHVPDKEIQCQHHWRQF